MIDLISDTHSYEYIDLQSDSEPASVTSARTAVAALAAIIAAAVADMGCSKALHCAVTVQLHVTLCDQQMQICVSVSLFEK